VQFRSFVQTPKIASDHPSQVLDLNTLKDVQERPAKRARLGVLLSGQTTIGAQLVGLRRELLSLANGARAKGDIRRASPTTLEFNLYFDDAENARHFKKEYAKLANVASVSADLRTVDSDGYGVEALVEYRSQPHSPQPVGDSVSSVNAAQRAHIIASKVLSTLKVTDKKWEWNMIPMLESAHRAFDQGEGYLEVKQADEGDDCLAGHHVVKVVRFDGTTDGSQGAQLQLGEHDLECRLQAIEWSKRSLQAWHNSATVRKKYPNVQAFQASEWAKQLPELLLNAIGASAEVARLPSTPPPSG